MIQVEVSGARKQVEVGVLGKRSDGGKEADGGGDVWETE